MSGRRKSSRRVTSSFDFDPSDDISADTRDGTPGLSGRVRRRSALLRSGTAMIAGAAALAATALPAQAQFASITGFGDSYADTGSGPGGAFRIIGTVLGVPGVYPCVAPLASCRFTGSTNFNDTLQAIYGLPGLTNYSIGGARTDNTNTMPYLGRANDYGLQYQLQQFSLSGTRFSERDLITLSIGGNDLSAVNISGLTTDAQKITQLTTSATGSAERAVAGVQVLVAAGARNIAWLSTGSTKYFPAPPTGAGGVSFTDAQRDAWANTYFQQTQQLLLPLAQAGVRIFMFNFGVLQERIATNPGQYGFTGLYGPGVLPATDRCQAMNGYPNCFYDNSVHPTGAAMALIARYMANQIDAPTSVVPQGGITTSVASGFAGSVFGRLDGYRVFKAFGVDPAVAGAYAMATKAPASAAPASRWSMVSDVGYGGGRQDRQFYASGYDYRALGGTVGVEYRLDRQVRLGAVFGYSEPDVDLGVQNAHNRIKAYQFAGYGSYTGTNWFADVLLAYGRQDFALDRFGVLDTVSGSTSADTFTVAAKGGYLVDAGPVRAGPIAGLAYTHAAIHAYTETGDSLLTMMVDRQTLDNLTGDAGLQVRVPMVLGQGLYSPYVNITAEHDFLGSGRVVTTTQVTAPLLPVLTPVPDTSGRTYGKVAGGVAAIVAGNVSATVTAATTFGREGGNDFGVSGGLKIAF